MIDHEVGGAVINAGKMSNTMTPQCPHLSKMIRSTFSFQTEQIKL